MKSIEMTGIITAGDLQRSAARGWQNAATRCRNGWRWGERRGGF